MAVMDIIKPSVRAVRLIASLNADFKRQLKLPDHFNSLGLLTAPYKQIIIAMGAGATASLSAFDHLIRSSAPAA